MPLELTQPPQAELEKIVTALTATSVQSGLFLDALVAEHVFGWINVHEVSGTPNQPNHLMGIPPGGKMGTVPKFSSDETAARLVVEKVFEMDDLSADIFYANYDGFDMEELKPGQPIKFIEYRPLDICVAALKAATKVLE